jgi:hypothetical protein
VRGDHVRVEYRQQVADLLLARDRIVQRKLGLDGVAVAAALPPARDVAGLDQLDHDPVRGAFGYPDRVTDLAQASVRVGGDAQQDLRVVGQERPARCLVARDDTRLAFLDSCVMRAPRRVHKRPVVGIYRHR